MKKIILFLVMAFIVDVAAAQEKGKKAAAPSAEKQATQMVNQLNTKVGLTDRQKIEMKKWFTETFKKKNEKLKKAVTKEAKAEINKKTKQAVQNYLKETLTPEQFKKYRENKAKPGQGKARQQGKKKGVK